MSVGRYIRVALSALFVVGGGVESAAQANAQRLIDSKDPSHPRVQYADSLISLNDRCIVREGSLSPAYKAVYVNGSPIGFC